MLQRLGDEAISVRSMRDTWWSQTESNRRHPACKAGALPTELWPHSGIARRAVGDRRTSTSVVGPGRLELPTLRLSGVRSNHLSYGPVAMRQAGRSQARDRTLLHAKPKAQRCEA